MLESDPYRRLSYTWHTFTPEWAGVGISDEHLARWRPSPGRGCRSSSSRSGDMVKLTVVHDGFAPASAVMPGISEGWPRLVSDLKTLLETGDTLPAG